MRILETASGPVEIGVKGSGPAVIVVHGRGFGSSWRNYEWIAGDLDEFQLITVSRPGYGHTPISSGESFGQQGQMLTGVLDALDIGNAVMIGVSNGGPPVLSAVAAHPDRVRAVVLACALAPHFHSKTPEDQLAIELDERELKKEYEQLREVMQRSIEDEEFARAVLNMTLTETEMERLDQEPVISEDLRSRARFTLEAPPGIDGVRNDRLQTQISRTSQPSAFDTPLLVLHGDEDTTVRPAHAEFHAGLNPASKLQMFAGGSHAFLTTFRSEVVPSIRRFLNELEG